MWAELIFSRDDLARLLGEALPLVIRFEEGGKEHSLALDCLSDVALVADVGLRVSCKAQVHWPVLGMEVPVTISALTLLLLPTIGHSPEGDKLAFRGSIEKADFAGVPGILDHTITSAINARLAAGADTELAWNFTEALAYVAPLPEMLSPLASFAIKPAWGKVRITDEAIVYAASFHSALVRRGNAVPDELASGPRDEPLKSEAAPAAPEAPRPKRSDATVDRYVALGVMGLAAGVAFLAVGGASASRRSSSWR